MQISESHCGPAVVQMLLSSVGINVTQEDLAEAGGATRLIELNGMRVDQLGLAVQRLTPQVVFYYKDHATLDELARIVNQYRHPVGVEWQGLFEEEDDTDEEENTNPRTVGLPADISEQSVAASEPPLLPDAESEDNDYGHFSLIVRADRRQQQFIIADPYKDYVSQARIFSFSEFESRWYDYNEVTDPVTGQLMLVEDYHMLFVVVRRGVVFPLRMGMHSIPPH